MSNSMTDGAQTDQDRDVKDFLKGHSALSYLSTTIFFVIMLALKFAHAYFGLSHAGRSPQFLSAKPVRDGKFRMKRVADETRSQPRRASLGVYILWGVMTLLSLLVADINQLFPSFLTKELLFFCLIGFFFLRKLPVVAEGPRKLSKFWRWLASIAIIFAAQWAIFISVATFGWMTFFVAALAPENSCIAPFKEDLCNMATSIGPQDPSGINNSLLLLKLRDRRANVCRDDRAHSIYFPGAWEHREVYIGGEPSKIPLCFQLGSYSVVMKSGEFGTNVSGGQK
jgi:hypothetical protein